MNTYLKILLTSALVTFIIRAIPFFILNKKEIPSIIEYLGENLPSAIMGLLVVFALKDVNIKIYPYAIPELLSSSIIILSYYFRKNLLLSIALGTFSYMFFLQYIFI